MRTKGMRKIILIAILMCSTLLVFTQSKVMAASSLSEEPVVKVADSIQDIINAGNQFINEGKSGTSKTAEGWALELLPIGQILFAIAVAVLSGATLVMAIRWITATPDKKAKLKEQLIGLVVSAVVIFGAVGIWNLVKYIAEQVENSL